MNPFAIENQRLRAQVDDLLSRIEELEGRLRSNDPDCPLAWGLTRHEGQLVGALIRAGGNFVPRVHIEGLLWGKRKPAEPHRNVYVLIHRCRQKLKPHAIRIDAERHKGYSLRWIAKERVS